MTVVSSREVLPRTFSHRFGESPTAERKYIVTVDAPTPTQDVIGHIGIVHGAAHPEYPYLLMLDASLSETDRHHVEVSYRYEIPQSGSGSTDFQPNPLQRRDVWSFAISGVSVPCTTYYDDNDQLLPLINTAGDFIESAMTEVSEVRAVINSNRPTFPLALAAYVANTLNDSEYLGCPKYTWKCNGISGQQAVEVVNGIEVRYYQITAELAYRSSGWQLLLPNVGWSVWSEQRQEKIRAYVGSPTDDDPSTRYVPSANPVALNEDGSIRLDSDLQGSGRPDILVRRVHRAVPFANYFGTPTF